MTVSTEYAYTTLAARIAGPVLTPDDAGYEEEVMGFNVAHQPAPAVVVGATSADDVAAAIDWAAASGLAVVAQSTGHGLTGDLAGTLMITTGRLDSVVIDAEARTARVGAGVRWRAVIDAAAPHGLAPLNGSSSAVGVVGYTLGGGMGLMARQYGFAADHVRSLTIVTGDGEIRTVDAEQHADLFWAIRGGKVGFGIVTAIEFDLVPVSALYAGGLFFPGSEAAAVLQAWRTWAPTLPDEVTTSVALLRLPPDPQLPPPLQGQFVVHLRFASTDLASAEALLAPMRRVAPVMMDAIVPNLPYAACDAIHMDPTTPMPCFDRGLTLSTLTEETVDTLLMVSGISSDSVLALVELRLMGGALSGTVDNAVPGRDAAYSVYVLGVLAGPMAPAVPGQVDRMVGVLAPWRDAGLPNFVGHARPGEWAALWTGCNRARLLTVAQAYDPEGVFGAEQALGLA